MSGSDFDALLPRLGRVTAQTVTLVRRIMVNGERPAEVAASAGTSRQRLYAAVRRFERAAQSLPAEWRRVEVWLPPELAAQVEELARRAHADLIGAVGHPASRTDPRDR